MKDCVRRHLTEQFGDDAEVTDEIYAEYVKTSAEKMRELSVALASRDAVAMDRLTHALKGNALMVGDRPTADAAIALRQAVQASDTDAWAERLADLKALVDEICG